MSAAVIAALATAITSIVSAIAGLIVAWRSNGKAGAAQANALAANQLVVSHVTTLEPHPEPPTIPPEKLNLWATRGRLSEGLSL
jgi:hypothetical protein